MVSAVGSGVSLCSADGEGEGTAAADGEGKALCAAVAAGDGAGETVPDAVQAQKTAAIINAAEKTQYAFNLFMLRIISPLCFRCRYNFQAGKQYQNLRFRSWLRIDLCRGIRRMRMHLDTLRG